MQGDDLWKNLRYSVKEHRQAVTGLMKEIAGDKFPAIAEHMRDVPVLYMPMRALVGGNKAPPHSSYRAEADNVYTMAVLCGDSRFSVSDSGVVKMNPKRIYAWCERIVFTPEGLDYHCSDDVYGRAEGPLRCFSHEAGHAFAHYLSVHPRQLTHHLLGTGVLAKAGIDIRQLEMMTEICRGNEALGEFVDLFALSGMLSEEDAEAFAMRAVYRATRKLPKVTDIWDAAFRAYALSTPARELATRYRDGDMGIIHMYAPGGRIRTFLEQSGNIPVIKTRKTHVPVPAGKAEDATTLGELLFSE